MDTTNGLFYIKANGTMLTDGRTVIQTTV